LAAERNPMFTGLIEEAGSVQELARQGAGWRLRVAAGGLLASVALGDSISVNGCCLTAAALGQGWVAFDLLEETLRVTNLGGLMPGMAVNLESSLRVGGKLGGHFVTGHIDGTGEIVLLESRGADHHLRVRAPAGSGRLLVPKGSVAIDGISLTVGEVAGDVFSVWLIPHTWGVTNLSGRRVGDRVNLEFDMLGKYVDQLLAARLGTTRAT
jgi:riboflavin synthase